MSDDPRADVVSRQYERWRYPKPLTNLEEMPDGVWHWTTPPAFTGFCGPTGTTNPTSTSSSPVAAQIRRRFSRTETRVRKWWASISASRRWSISNI
jgi:hypothetical protein